MKLRRLGEDRLLKQLLPSLGKSASVITGAGDDCAVVRFGRRGDDLLLKCDCVVEGVHFAPKTPPEAVGWKAMMRSLSDFAAMAGWPQYALITLMAPPRTELKWVKGVYRGLKKAAAQFDVVIVGGETSSTPGPVAISVAVTGFVERGRAVLRSGGRAGDALLVTGRLGGSIGGHHLRFEPRIREARWLAAHAAVHAMMDLSDGLGADLPRLAEASGVGFEIDRESLPRNKGVTIPRAISDGEDYELLFAIQPREVAHLQKSWRRKFPTVPLTRIGRLTQPSSSSNPRFPRGYFHFQ